MVEKAQFGSHLLHPKHWPLWLGVGFMRLTQLLPLRWQMKMGAGLGRLVLRFAAKRKHTAERNLQLCFPDMPQQERDNSTQTEF